MKNRIISLFLAVLMLLTLLPVQVLAQETGTGGETTRPSIDAVAQEATTAYPDCTTTLYKQSGYLDEDGRFYVGVPYTEDVDTTRYPVVLQVGDTLIAATDVTDDRNYVVHASHILGPGTANRDKGYDEAICLLCGRAFACTNDEAVFAKNGCDPAAAFSYSDVDASAVCDANEDLNLPADQQFSGSYQFCWEPALSPAAPTVTAFRVSSALPVELVYGSEIHTQFDTEDKFYCEYRYDLPLRDLTYAVATSADEEGSFHVYTLDQLYSTFDTGVEQLTGSMTERWPVGTETTITLSFCGIEYDVPVKVVAPQHILEDLTYTGGTTYLADKLHSNRYNQFYDIRYVLDTLRLHATYDGGKTADLTLEELAILLDLSYSCYTPGEENWQAGSRYTINVTVLDKCIPIPVEILKDPIESLTPESPILLSDSSRYNINGTYRYDFSKWEKRFTAKLSQQAANVYNNGKTTFTGTAIDIFQLFGINSRYINLTSDQSSSNVWTPDDGIDHTFTLTAGSASYSIPVTLLNAKALFQSLALEDPDYVVTLTKGVDAKRCEDGVFYYDVTTDGDLRFVLTLTDIGMIYFNTDERTFPGTNADIFQRFQYGARQMADNITPDGNGRAVSTVSLGYGMFGDPEGSVNCDVNVQFKEENQIKSIRCTNYPVALYEGADTIKFSIEHPEWKGLFTLQAAMDSGRVQFEVALYDDTVITGSSADIAAKLGFAPMLDTAVFESQRENSWEIGDDTQTHSFTVRLGTKLCNVAVKLKEATRIALDEKIFPDEVFRSYLDREFAGSDGLIPVEAVTEIDCSYKNITDLSGIEKFPLLQSLTCRNCALTKLDLSKVSTLINLDCSNNSLTQLDVSKNTKLDRLFCSNNALTSLDVSQNTALTWLSCGSNPLRQLSLQNCTELLQLNCLSAGLTELDVSHNTKLIDLECDENALTTLDVTHNPDLSELHCSNNRLTSLTLTSCPELMSLFCSHNQLTALDLSQNSKLIDVFCDNNQLTALDISQKPDLVFFSCENNALQTLTLGNNPKLRELYCSCNMLQELDVSQCMALSYLDCSANLLTTLRLPGEKTASQSLLSSLFTPAVYAGGSTAVPALEYLNCSLNRLTRLDVRGCPKLVSLTCIDNHSSQLLTVNVATLDGLELSLTGARGGAKVLVNGETAPGTLSGTLDASLDLAQLTLANAQNTYVTTVHGNAYSFFGVADGAYTLTASSRWNYADRNIEVQVSSGVITGLDPAVFTLHAYGDVNLDGTVDVYDLQRLYEHCAGIELLQGYAQDVSDLNRDKNTGSKSVLDMQRLYDQLTEINRVDSGKTG